MAALLRRRPRLFALVAAALFLRLLVPAGYMVAGGALVPCPAAVAAPVAHHGHHDAPTPHGEAPCPFAALSAPALPPADPFTLASAPAPFPALPLPVLAPLAKPRAAAPPPPSTGPPAAV